MRLSELYQHKADYEEMLTVLNRSKELPRVDDAIHNLTHALNKCRFFEKYRIDLPYWDDNLRFDGVDVYPGAIAQITNQHYTDDGSTEPLVFAEPREFLSIWFSTGAYVFGEDYPTELYDEFFAALKAACPPEYEDTFNRHLYYKPEDAAKAYDTCKQLLAEYRAKYAAQWRDRKLAALKAELAKLETEAGAVAQEGGSGGK